MLDGWLEEFAAEIEAAEAGLGFAHGYVMASDMSGWAAADRAYRGVAEGELQVPVARAGALVLRPSARVVRARQAVGQGALGRSG